MAMAPASRAASRSSGRSSRAPAEVTWSSSGKGHAFDQKRWCGGAEIAIEIARRNHVEEHGLQVRGDGHFRNRIGELAILDPDAGSAAAVLASHHVDALAEHFGD